jgi:hypothetical protein
MSDAHEAHVFNECFTLQLVDDMPDSPGFLSTSFSTAVIRCAEAALREAMCRWNSGSNAQSARGLADPEAAMYNNPRRTAPVLLQVSVHKSFSRNQIPNTHVAGQSRSLAATKFGISPVGSGALLLIQNQF